MTIFRRVLAAIATTLLTTSAVVALGVAPAQADGARPFWFTGWDGVMYSTTIVEFNPALLDNGQCIDFASSLDNRIGSISNNSSSDLIVYDLDACAPGLTSTVWHNSIGNMNSTWNNRIDSARRSWSNLTAPGRTGSSPYVQKG
jgi:hypothetical protein